MFEGTIVPAVVDRTAEGGAMRSPCWGEIVARLAAANDLRRAMTVVAGVPAGNFRRFAEREACPPRHGQYLVNPDDLAHGKAHDGKNLPPRMAW